MSTVNTYCLPLRFSGHVYTVGSVFEMFKMFRYDSGEIKRGPMRAGPKVLRAPMQLHYLPTVCYLAICAGQVAYSRFIRAFFLKRADERGESEAKQ